MPVRAVVFDVGETLVDEDRYWREVAARVGLPPHVVTAALGVTIARGEEHTELWRHLDACQPESIREVVYDAADLYPDAVPCLRSLRDRGFLLGAAGNQSPALETWLRAQGLPLDVIGSSASWGARKPSADFFARVVDAVGIPAEEIVYVGDRVDNDVEPAARAGLVAVHLRRGPWGLLQRASPHARLVLGSLAELPAALASLA
ncbi:MAG TPA: HAD family hydrolase [Gaiellaceae bacterium]|nr:HAD family hydrolase [Gaiellaceae bacterium]